MAHEFNVWMTDCGVGRILKWSLMTILPVLKESILKGVGSIIMQSSVLDAIVLSVFGAVHTA
jgi:hypothetical protein